MSLTVIVCGRCWQGFRCQGDVPPRCPMCHEETVWTTLEPVSWDLTWNDCRLLRSLKIDPEVEPTKV